MDGVLVGVVSPYPVWFMVQNEQLAPPKLNNPTFSHVFHGVLSVS
jgi:hypothetical protein